MPWALVYIFTYCPKALPAPAVSSSKHEVSIDSACKRTKREVHVQGCCYRGIVFAVRRGAYTLPPVGHASSVEEKEVERLDCEREQPPLTVGRKAQNGR